MQELFQLLDVCCWLDIPGSLSLLIPPEESFFQAGELVKERQNQAREDLNSLASFAIPTIVIAYLGLGKLVLISSTQLVNEKSHSNAFSKAHIAKDYQLLGIGGAIPVDKFGISQQVFASLNGSKISKKGRLSTIRVARGKSGKKT